ncbi:MAG: enoyl-CoA hydratase-related protein [Candidatus Rokuibacteriota bacterium]
MLEITDISGATVAALSGACAGDDLERALACDVRLAADSASFSGESLSDGAAIRLARLLGEARAKDIVLTGRRFEAREALRLGVVTRVVEAARLADEARATVALIASRPPLAVRAVKEAVERSRDLTPGEALALEHERFRRLLDTADHREAVDAFFAKRRPAFEGR